MNNTTLKYSCEKCKYFTNTKQHFDNHLLSKKHIKQETHQEIEEYKFVCSICNKKYKCRSGLWNHNKNCKKIKPPHTNSEVSMIREEIKKLQNIITKQNETNENLYKIIMELVKKEPTLTTVNNNNNFNIKIFLNQDCKNAVNFIDFIKSIPIELTDLLEVGKIGYENGVLKILTDGLKKYSIYDRPIHYYINNENEKNTLHIKHEDEWKEEEKEVKQIFDEGIFTFDNKLDKTYSSNIHSTMMNRDVGEQIKNHSSIYRENFEEQNNIMNGIIPTVKIP